MGQKIHPRSVRLGYIQQWSSRWFAKKGMADFIEEDVSIRKYIKKKLATAAVARVIIERPGKMLRVIVHSARPGVVIGNKGANIENIRADIEDMTGRKTFVNVMDIREPELDAQLVADAVAAQLVKNVSFRRAMRRTIEQVMAAGALGCKVMVAGRLGGAEIARTEWLRQGRIPLQTFRADIDYGASEASTQMGNIGVKVWIFKEELYKKSERDLIDEARRMAQSEVPPPPPPPSPAPAVPVVPEAAPADVAKPILDLGPDEPEIEEPDVNPPKG